MWPYPNVNPFIICIAPIGVCMYVIPYRFELVLIDSRQIWACTKDLHWNTYHVYLMTVATDDFISLFPFNGLCSICIQYDRPNQNTVKKILPEAGDDFCRRWVLKQLRNQVQHLMSMTILRHTQVSVWNASSHQSVMKLKIALKLGDMKITRQWLAN